MAELRKTLAPLTDWIPPEIRQQLDVEVWWLIFLGVALVLLVLLLLIVRGLFRALLGGRKRRQGMHRALRENLNACPLPTRPEGNIRLTVYHIPVRLRLVIVAPAGRDMEVDATKVEKLLERLVPGLGRVVERDRPRIRVWPAQLSHQGFLVTFNRNTPLPEREGQPSRWILVAGRTLLGKQSVLLGLGLYAHEANTVGRRALEPHQWLDVLRLHTLGGEGPRAP